MANTKMTKKKVSTAKVIIQFLLICWVFIQVFPMLFMFMSSFKSNSQIMTDPWGWPNPVVFDNYAQAWLGKSGSPPMSTFFLNSLIITVCTLILLCLLSMLCGYSLARFRFPGHKIIYILIICFIAVPIQALIVPVFVFFQEIGLLNNLLGVILLFTAFNLPFATVIMKTNFEAIPHEIEEAALVDGCRSFGVFWHVAAPLSRGSIATVAIVNLTVIWSEFMYSSVLLMTKDVRTLPVAINLFNSTMYNSSLGALMAGLSIATAPMLIAYFIFQKQIVKGMAVGAIK